MRAIYAGICGMSCFPGIHVWKWMGAMTKKEARKEAKRREKGWRSLLNVHVAHVDRHTPYSSGPLELLGAQYRMDLASLATLRLSMSWSHLECTYAYIYNDLRCLLDRTAKAGSRSKERATHSEYTTDTTRSNQGKQYPLGSIHPHEVV